MWRVLLLSLVLLGQASATAPSPAPLTDVESLRVQNLALEKIIVTRAMSDWQAKATTLKADLEKSRPGWLWNPDTGAWTKADPPAKK